MEMEQGAQFDDLQGIIVRRAGLVGIVTGAACLLAVFIGAILPNEYEATNVLLVEPQSISQNLVESGVPETAINNRLHLIQMQILSRSRLSRVISDLEVYPELELEMTREELIEYMTEKINVAPILPELATEARAQSGVRAAEVVVNTFALTFRHTNPRVAADVANRLANDFIAEHIKERVQVSGDTSEFIDAELERLARTIEAVEEQIGTVKSQNAGTLPEDFSASQRLYERALASKRDAERELAIATSDIAFYRQQAATGSGDEYANRNFINPSRRLEILEVKMAEYRSRGFTDKHPDIISGIDEMARLRVEIANTGKDETHLSLSQRNARAEEQRATLRANASRDDLAHVLAQLTELEEKMAATPRVAEQLAALERRQEALLESFNDYSGKRLEASVAAQMESRQKGEKFRVLEAAYPPTAPSSPNRLLIVSLGLLLGLGLGGSAALLAEVGDKSFHDSRSLQTALSLPVLAAIPEVLLASDQARLRARRIRRVLAAAGVTAVVMLASLSGYWIVNGTSSIGEITGTTTSAAEN